MTDLSSWGEGEGVDGKGWWKGFGRIEGKRESRGSIERSKRESISVPTTATLVSLVHVETPFREYLFWSHFMLVDR